MEVKVHALYCKCSLQLVKRSWYSAHYYLLLKVFRVFAQDARAQSFEVDVQSCVYSAPTCDDGDNARPYKSKRILLRQSTMHQLGRYGRRKETDKLINAATKKRGEYRLVSTCFYALVFLYERPSITARHPSWTLDAAVANSESYVKNEWSYLTKSQFAAQTGHLLFETFVQSKHVIFSV